MFDSLSPSFKEGFTERDFKFENEVLWEVLYIEGDYNYSTRSLAKKLTSFSETEETKKTISLDKPIKLPQPLVKSIYFLSQRFKLNKNKSSEEQVTEDKDEVLKTLASDEPQENWKIFSDISHNSIEEELADEEHKKLLKEEKDSYLDEKRSLHTYNLADFPLAEPELINKLAETHAKYFQLLSSLQDTHTPTDFVTAFRIQDRIAYLLDNQTLLYKTLTKKLIKYLEKINERLERYYSDVTLKREDLKKMNAQISRFNEYERKTQTRIDQAEKETNLYKEDLKTYTESLRNLQPELQVNTDVQDLNQPKETNLEQNNNTIVH